MNDHRPEVSSPTSASGLLLSCAGKCQCLVFSPWMASLPNPFRSPLQGSASTRTQARARACQGAQVKTFAPKAFRLPGSGSTLLPRGKSSPGTGTAPRLTRFPAAKPFFCMNTLSTLFLRGCQPPQSRSPRGAFRVFVRLGVSTRRGAKVQTVIQDTKEVASKPMSP